MASLPWLSSQWSWEWKYGLLQCFSGLTFSANGPLRHGCLIMFAIATSACLRKKKVQSRRQSALCTKSSGYTAPGNLTPDCLFFPVPYRRRYRDFFLPSRAPQYTKSIHVTEAASVCVLREIHVYIPFSAPRGDVLYSGKHLLNSVLGARVDKA